VADRALTGPPASQPAIGQHKDNLDKTPK
jgi:hypothetical protein